MTEEQREKLAEHLWDLVPTDGPMNDGMAANILANPQAHIDQLVAAGVLEPDRTWCRENQRVVTEFYRPGQCGSEHTHVTSYRVVTPKRVVKAGYRKCDDGTWIWTCAEHPELTSRMTGGFDTPQGAKDGTVHFREKHADDQVTWDDPPHEHHFTWQMSRGELWQPYCSCGIWLEERIGGAPYSGPVPEHLRSAS